MDEDIPLPFDLPAVARKKVSAAFDGRRITSDGGVMLLAQAERRMGVAGHKQLSLFNAHYDERCFLPIHVYDTATSRPVAVLLRPGKTPSGVEVHIPGRLPARTARTGVCAKRKPADRQ